MKKIVLLLLCLTLGAACNAIEPGELHLTAAGLGPFKVGMTFQEANGRLKRKLARTPTAIRATANCDYLAVPDLPGVSFVFVKEVLKRIDITTPHIRTSGLLRVGNKVDLAAAPLLASAVKEPLDHVPDGYALILEEADGRNGLAYHIEGNRVVRVLAGDKRVIRFAEGCD